MSGKRGVRFVVLLVLVLLSVTGCSDQSDPYSGYPPYTPTANQICEDQRSEAINACYYSSCNTCGGFGCLFCWESCSYSTSVWNTYYTCCQTEGCVQSVSGYIRTAGGTPVPGVTVDYSGVAFSTTADNGYYSLGDLTSAGTVTPTKSGYCFDPENRSYAFAYGTYTNQNFTASLAPCPAP